jgi:hypothetical protein
MADTESTPPADCGLAIALPTSLAAVEAATLGGPYQDYVGRACSIGSAERVWKAGFGRVAAATEALAGEAARLGVVVSRNAALADLQRLFRQCAVVTVIAHWRGAELVAADIRIDPERLIDRIEQEASPTGELIRAGLPGDWKAKVLRANGSLARRSLVAEMLDQRMQRLPCLVAAPDGFDWDMDAATLRHANRAALDSWWPEAFIPGNRLELSDGLHAPERIAACVPQAWSGIVDLSNCQSAQLIERVKQGRPDRIVIANERETNPLRRMALLRIVYALLSEGERNYAHARVTLSDAMLAPERWETRMSKLKRVLEDALPDATSLGGGRNVDRDRLVHTLRQLLSELGRAYWMRAGVAVVALAVLLGFFARYSDQPALLVIAVSAMGITFAGALFTLRQVVDEMARVDTILSLAAELSLEALTEVTRQIAAIL